MAGNEIYRVEIPIIVDDKTEEPFRRAEERVNKFQRNAEKANRKTREHFESLAKLQVEPVMKVRDQLTNSVLKADKLIKKLDVEEASPLIEAQDRVSSVVTRIDAALKALDKGDVTVLAEMKGPLMDEIVKAKSSLAALNNVKAGPVADLRGELFGQLSKATSQLRGLDMMHVEPQATLRERVAWKAREIGSDLRRLTSRVWTVVIQAKDKASGIIKGIFGNVKRLVASPMMMLGMGAGIGGMTKVGFDLVVERENVTMAFETLLGNADKAKKRVEELTKFAGKTPFSRDEIYEASRVLEVFTHGALSTSKGLKLVGDVAAGTQQDFKDVALWVGRLYDAMASGRPVGEMTARLQEMGAISGEDRAKLEALAESGKHISETWPEAEKVLGRFNNQMDIMSEGFGNLLLSTKMFFKENVVMRWGKGVEEAIKPVLQSFREWRSEHPEAVKQVGDTVERIAKTTTSNIIGFFEKAYARIKQIVESPEFQNATFGEKVRMLFEAGLDDAINWLSGPGKDKLVDAFVVIGEAAFKAYGEIMKTLGKKSIEELKEGNLMGAAIPAMAMWVMGGGTFAKGAWGASKWAKGKLPPLRTTTVPPTVGTAAGAGGTGAVAKALPKVLPALGKVKPWLGPVGIPITAGIETAKVIKAEDKRPAVVKGAGRVAGMAAGGKAGMMAGGAVGGVPGAAAGGILGGIGGFFGGEAVAEKINAMLDKVDFTAIKEKAQATWDNMVEGAQGVWDKFKESGSTAADWVKETITWDNFIEGIGFVVGWLETTLFSAEWWLDKWQSVKDWTSEKWASFVEVWNSAVETIKSTIFSVEWWLGKWQGVKDWTKEKWNTFIEIWNNAVETIKSTIFSAKWWATKWQGVKDWTSEKWDTFVEIWSTVRDTINNTIFSKDWWLGKWQGVKDWAKEKLEEPFSTGREKGRQAGKASVKHAYGGILTHPHLGLVAEAGPEAIIPLSTGMRGRGLSLWKEAGKRLGVSTSNIHTETNVVDLAEYRNKKIKAYAGGGFAGAVKSLPTAQPIPVPTMQPLLATGTSPDDIAMSNWLNTQMSEPFQEVIDQTENWGLDIVDNTIKGRDSKSLSMVKWLGSQVTEPFNGVISQTMSWGRSMISDFMSGRDSAGLAMMNWLNRHVQEPFINIVNQALFWGRNMISNFISGMESKRGDLSTEVRTLTNLVVTQFQQGLGIASPSKMAFDIGRYTMLGLIKGMDSVDIKKFTEKQMSELVNTMGAVSGNVTGWLVAALMATGTPLSWLPGLQRLVQAESGGNPFAVNRTPVGREHATGLLQTLPSTFRAYAAPGMGNIMNPIHNAAAAINYIKSRYGSVYNTPLFRSGGRYAGYAQGDIVTRPHLGLVGEAGPEAIIPLSARMRSRSLSLWEKTGQMLGVRPYEFGGFTGLVPAAATDGGYGSISIVNNVSVSVGGDGSGETPSAREIADEVADEIAMKISSIFNNMPLRR